MVIALTGNDVVNLILFGLLALITGMGIGRHMPQRRWGVQPWLHAEDREPHPVWGEPEVISWFWTRRKAQQVAGERGHVPMSTLGGTLPPSHIEWRVVRR